LPLKVVKQRNKLWLISIFDTSQRKLESIKFNSFNSINATRGCIPPFSRFHCQFLRYNSGKAFC